MLIQSRKRNSLMCLLLVVSSATVYAPEHVAEEDPRTVEEIGADSESPLLGESRSCFGSVAALFRRVGYACSGLKPSKSTCKKIGAGACGILTLGGIVGGGIGGKMYYDAKYPDALVIKDFYPCSDSGNAIAWDRLNDEKYCISDSEDYFFWAVAKCQNDVLKYDDSCVPICVEGGGGDWDRVPNGWTSEADVAKLCKNLGIQNFAVYCDPRNRDWAIEQFNKYKVEYCEIAENGGDASVFMFPKKHVWAVVNFDAYFKKVLEKDLMESEECTGYANKAREIAKCNGKFTCDTMDCGVFKKNSQQPPRISKGKKKLAKEQKNKKRRAKRSS